MEEEGSLQVNGEGNESKSDHEDNLEEEGAMKDSTEADDNDVFLKVARMVSMFPDEIDTCIDVADRVRFQWYRGLKSFHLTVLD